MTDTCPHCGVSLVGLPIPVELQASYGYRTHFDRTISIYSRERDRTTEWECPDCGKRWER